MDGWLCDYVAASLAARCARRAYWPDVRAMPYVSHASPNRRLRTAQLASNGRFVLSGVRVAGGLPAGAQARRSCGRGLAYGGIIRLAVRPRHHPRRRRIWQSTAREVQSRPYRRADRQSRAGTDTPSSA
jgi:hypothetical protein